MKEIKIVLNSIEKVKSFHTIVDKVDCEMDLRRDKYVVDAKSIMGIFSLDLTKTLTLVVHTKDEDIFEEIHNKLLQFEER